MKKTIYDTLYDAVYRLFNEGDYGLTINVGGIDLRLYETNDHTPMYVWNCGIVANNRVYRVGDLYMKGKGPGTYAEIFSGDYDIIDGLADDIYNDNFNK